MLRAGLCRGIGSHLARGGRVMTQSIASRSFPRSMRKTQVTPLWRQTVRENSTSASSVASRSRTMRITVAASGVALGCLAGAAWLVPEPRQVLVGLGRFLSCLGMGFYIAGDYKWSLRGLEGEEYERVQKEVHLRCAKRLLALFQYNKGIFIKFGQHLAAMDYLLPEEYTSTMRVLQDHAPFVSYADIEGVFIEEFGKKPTELFDDFDTEPLAAASLAQVHVAHVNGEKVAVKVQFPGLRETCQGDSMTIEVLINIAAKMFPDFELKWFIQEINKNLPLELDFIHEAKNSELVSNSFASDPEVLVPAIDWDHSTDRVLTMEFCEGVHVDDIPGLKRYDVDHAELATKITDIFSKMIFADGFVHCDPHPGNILVRSRNLTSQDSWCRRVWNRIAPWLPYCSATKPFEVVLLDHGLYRELNSGSVRTDYLHLWDALINFDEAKIEKYAKKFGASDHKVFCSIMTARAWDSLATEGDIDSRMTPEEQARVAEVAQRLLKEITGTLATVKPELLLLFKTNDNLRAINRILGSPINTYLGTAKTVSKELYLQRLRDDSSWSAWLAAYRKRTADRIRLKAAELYLSTT